MSDTGSDEGGEDVASEVEEEDPPHVPLTEPMDDPDEVDPVLEPIQNNIIGERDGEETQEDEVHTPVLEREKSEVSGFMATQQAKEIVEGVIEETTKAIINSKSEKDSRQSLKSSSRESPPPSAPVQKELPLEYPSTDPAENAMTGDVLVSGPRASQTRSSAASNIPQSAEWIYRAAAPVIRNPYSSAKTCSFGRSVHEYAKPNSSRRRSLRNVCIVSTTNPYRQEPARWEVNRAASVPMRARPWKAGGSRQSRAIPVEDWKKREQALTERRDRDLATKLGYETLVGNLVHINIPGSRDLNRSWNHFLNRDVMTWGFPYWKGSKERPQEPSPPPYLVYELKEKFWKHPRARSFKTA